LASPAIGSIPRFGWPQTGFGRLWLGETVSLFGSQVTFLALPLTAVVVLGATPGQMGILGAVDNLPYVLFGLFVGVLVDRVRRRQLMVLANLGRAAAVASVPVAFVMGWLSYTQLLFVVFAVGVGNIIFDVAYQAQLTDLVPEQDLVTANGKLETSRSLSMVAGPGLGGALVQALGAPVAIVVDALSYIVSAVTVGSIREPEAARTGAHDSVLRDVVGGIRIVLADHRLVGLAFATALISLALNAWLAVFVLHLANDLRLDAGLIGLLFVVFGLGGAVGAIGSAVLVDRIGTGRLLLGAPLVAALGALPILAVTGSSVAQLAALFVGAGVFGVGLIAYNVTAAGLRQTLAPQESRGRVIATLRFVEWGVMPVGSLLGGFVGEQFGPVAAMATAIAFIVCAAGVVLVSPLARHVSSG